MTRRTLDELEKTLESLREFFHEGAIYIHASGDKYRLTRVSLDEETMQARIVYSPLSHPKVEFDRLADIFIHRFTKGE